MINKYKIARKIISSPNYLQNRMDKMISECAFYIDQMCHAKNALLQKAYAKMAEIYLKRHEYYFKKQIGHELRESI